MIKIKKFKFVIFDLDGVIFDSKKNMEISWKKTSKKFNLDIDFKDYFKNIGIPFQDILKKLNIKKNLNNIEKEYKKNSIKYINKINIYKGIKKFTNFLDKKKIDYSVVTSKDFKRSKFLINKFKINTKSIHCPSRKLKGKPSPELINYCIKKNNFKKKNCCYIGDTDHDYIAAKKANISFIFTAYGYGKNKKKYKYYINKPKQLFNFL